MQKIYHEEIHKTIFRKISLLQDEIAQPVVLETAHRMNSESKNIEDREILEKDAIWRDDRRNSKLIASVLNTPCSQLVRSIIQKIPELAEIIVTDLRGVAICISNKTTDYYQADESWWQKSRLATPFYQGRPSLDKSAFSFGIPVGFNLLDPKNGKPVGVVKVVFDNHILLKQLSTPSPAPHSQELSIMRAEE